MSWLMLIYIEEDDLTDDGDGEGAVGLVPRAVGRNVGDGLFSNGEQLGRGVHRFHLYHHLGRAEGQQNIKKYKKYKNEYH